MNGRPRKPVERHLLEGTPVVPSTVAPSEFEAGRAKRPTHLSHEAQLVWKQVSKILGARRTETVGDFAALGVFCEVYVRWVQAKKELGTELMILDPVTDNHGEVFFRKKLNPLLKVVEAAEKNLVVLAVQLGLTPISRDKVKKAAGQEPPKAAKPGTVGWMLDVGNFLQEATRNDPS